MEIDEECTSPFFSSSNFWADRANVHSFSAMTEVTPFTYGKKRKKESDEEDICSGHPNQKIQKNNQFPSTMELLELLENWSITAEQAKTKPNWEKVHSELSELLVHVNTRVITETINRDKYERPLVWNDEKQLFVYYKELFQHWCVADVSSKRLGHIFIGTAIHIWALLMKDRCLFFDVWVAFLLEKRVQYISRDTWNLFFEFCVEFNNNTFASYNFEACWPTLNEEFVTFYRTHHI